MKIFNNNINKIQSAYNKNKTNIDKSSKVDKKDQFIISDQGKMIQKAVKMAKDSPDIRKEKIEKIKTQMKNGNYNIDSKLVAQKILEDINMRKG
ncbi:flagellar biosynthesis anti-sigma factor FlgM [Senegalia massiliensis]|uniref:Negative regulator of flagellin synthesis n=1 Tax=Senegalia massiliensis TaxID=1720316 RepID=A0A845R1S5_9CLOT|nr:flagellar biosynthesis anti-sigma factor FlgM [Senegalia massiliensis]NBI07372.1 flagellar biosynthesis anti-sigma factor FlgM [Senegalia massiliensis]